MKENTQFAVTVVLVAALGVAAALINVLMTFEQSGAGTSTTNMQAVLVGLVLVMRLFPETRNHLIEDPDCILIMS